ncbi:MAG: PAS domain S-box protein, partial [Desulfobacterales bacterium]|nr:PAS domain S-box protein [Desulfobacterales bacterium]
DAGPGARELAARVMAKTEGNPFYITSFLHLIIEENYIKREADGAVTLDMEAVANIPADADVAAHLIRKIESLDPGSREFLTRASILGARFTLDAVDLFLDEKHAGRRDAIRALVGVHLLVKSGENILFTHDRVQQAARAMLDDDEARALHLRAGQNIQAALDARGATSERMEDYLYHYNAAADLITDEGRRSELAGLNLALGKRLKNNAAYQAAESAFTRAIAFLPQNPFDADYDMAMELFTECGETLFLNLKYDEGEKRFETVLAHSKSPLDSATVYVKQINHFAAHHDLEKSMKIALSALEKLGVKLPLKLLKLSIVKDLLIVMRLLKNKKPEDVLDLPVTDDPLILARMEVLSAASPTAYIGYPDYLPLIILRMMIISITRGNSRISPYGYAAYAMLLCCLGWMESGYAFGRAALALMEKLDVKRLFSKVPYLFGFFINHWKKPVRDGLAFYDRAVAHGLETGDYEYASYAANYVMLYSFYYVESIDGLLARYPEQHRILAGFNKDHAVFLAKYWHQLLIVMNTPSGDGVTISGEMIDGDSLISLLEEKKDLTSLGVCMLGKLQLAYLAGDFREAERIRPGVIALTKALIGTIFNPICHFFAALTCIAYYRSHKKDSSLLREAKRSLKKLRKWGKAAPDNFLYMAQLVEAEWLSVKKKKVEALERYEAAVENARKAGNNLVLGVAGECMGRYLATIGLKEISRECIRRSILVFQEWGALNKSSRLQEEHRMEISRESIARGSVSTCHTSRAFNIELDLEALVETIESLTGNLKFDSLLETLLDAIMRNSGATRAVYLHVEPESPRVKAEKLANSPVRIFEGRDALPASFDLPTAWLEKCLSGSSRHVLTNMEVDPNPGREKRLESRMKSILIIPLIRHGSVRGLVYLENELIADAFREDQVQFLTLLAGQAAIAIENTLAFESLHAERDYSSDIIQNSPALICGIDGAGTTTFVNPVIEETTGYRKEELIGENWWELLHPGEEYEQVRRLFNAFARGEVVDHEMRVTRKNGERKIVIWNHVVKRDGRGGVVEIIGFGNDVTERKRAEEKLRRLRNHLTNIIDSMPSALVGVDLEGRVTRWNKTAERTTGVPASAARGKILSRVFPGMAPEMEKIAESIRTREAKQDRKRPRQTEDGARYEDVTIYPLIADEVEGAVIRIDDVTDKVRMEEMMIQSEKMLSVGGLAAGMAHEINNPLAGMMQTANVMASRLTDEKMPANLRAAKAAGISMEAVRGFMEARGVPNMVRTIYESGRRVAAIVDNMLSFARKSEERGAYHSLEELLDKTLELAAADYNLKKHHDFKLIEIKREYEGDLPPAFCEGGKIRQVLLNILRNGAQAMQEAGAEKPRFIIRTRSEEARGMVRMEIEDNGPGMDETTRKRVFEPFYTTKPEGVGTGLGLSVSY